jgi:hypothetical protein
MKAPEDSAEERREARRSLADLKSDLKSFSKECPLLIAVRGRIIAQIAGKEEGCDRKALENTIQYTGSTKLGVICNQLERGGWIRTERVGRKMSVYPIRTPPNLNKEFLLQEIPRPVHGPNAM